MQTRRSVPARLHKIAVGADQLEQLAVVGFDDVEDWLYTAPPLSSVSPDKAAIAATVVDLVVERMAGMTPAKPREIFPPYRLVVRESSAG